MHQPTAQSAQPTAAEVLERNLAALQASSARAVELIRGAAARRDVEFIETEEGVPSASIGARAMASRRRPMDEAEKLVGTIDVGDAAAVAVLGFGLGYHARVMAQRMRLTGVVFIFEPDVGLLRAVLERIDHSAWIRGHNVCLLTDPEDAAAISSAARGVEGLLALGFKLLQHPADRVRLGAAADRFSEKFKDVIKAVRTTVVTTLVQAEVTLRNQLMNVDRYVTSAGVGDLHGTLAGRPAIVVSAGPSLRRNIEVLSKPGLRDRFVIIAVQTVLKQLLARGIRPHFVTALDYHEISRRFYEGLTTGAVEGVTLVAEAKANPAILDAFPGAARFPGDRFLDELLGEKLVCEVFSREPVRELPGGVPAPAEETLLPGATVAHMAYYLARKLGCDPVILMGQDLGFTDGQYYAPGAAIHTVWSGELNGFNTLEMMEWQRIARGKYQVNSTRTVAGVTLPSEANLIRKTDVQGRTIYTDQQMATYLSQFERDFKTDSERGLTTIDATEGGVAKMFTTAMRLAEAVERYWPTGTMVLPEARRADDAARLKKLKERVRAVRQDTWKVGEISRKTVKSLSEMLKHHEDQARVNRLIEQVQANGDEVAKLQPAFTLVQHLNQTGTLKRVREDRKIGLDATLSALEKQKRQIERDIMNVGWIGDAADQLGAMLDDTIRMLDGGARVTRDLAAPEESVAATGRGRLRIAALIAVDTEVGGLGTARPLGAAVALGRNALSLTLSRLARCKQIDTVMLLGENPEAIRSLAGDIPGLKYEVIPTDGSPLASRSTGVRGARLWSAECWRGGLGTMTVYDEALAAAPMHRVMEEKGLDAAVVVGADWCLVDPAMIDECVDRYRRQTPGPSAFRVGFCQAPPGLGACLLDRGMMHDLAARAESAGVFASLGGVLGYVPLAPTADPIAKPACVTTDPRVRDAQCRFIPDSPDRRSDIGAALDTIGEAFDSAPALRIVEGVLEFRRRPDSPRELVLELCTGRRTSGARGQWLRGARDTIERPSMTLATAGRLLGELALQRPDAAVTFAGAGDPILHPELFKIVAHARRVGIAGIHVRTDLVCDAEIVDGLLECGADVISVDLMANSAESYRRIMGADLFEQVRGNVQRLIEGRAKRATAAGLPVPWIVPRLTRCDAVYEEIEAFFDHWLIAAGAAVIDALPAALHGERIEPLPVPAGATQRMAESVMTVLADDTVPANASDFIGERIIGDAGKDGLAAVWGRVRKHRQPTQMLEPVPIRGESWTHAGRSRVAYLDTGL